MRDERNSIPDHTFDRELKAPVLFGSGGSVVEL